MNIKHPKKHLIFGLILVHLLFIYLGGYFLSPEFTVYPYLTSLGLKPYLNLIDQHFPIIFFGPLSLPKSFTTNPQPLLSLFLGVVASTDILFFYLLKKYKTKNYFFWMTLFITSMFIFSGNTLWLETFIIPAILLLLLLNSKTPNHLFIGILASFVILARPTLAPAVLLLFVFKKVKPSRFLIAGLLSPFLITLAYLIYYQLFPSFLDLFFNFNSQYYSSLASKLPSLRQVFILSIITIPALLKLVKSKKYLSSLIILSLLLPAWPRFELIHLQPAIALTIYFLSINSSKKQLSPLFKSLLVFLIILSIKKIATTNYGNFYLTKETKEVSDFIKRTDQDQVFVLGGSDLIYPLSGKVPAGNFYLPSLPWYYQDQKLVARQLEALRSNPQSLVVINQDSSVSNLKLNDFAKPVFGYILEKYLVLHTVGPYQIYKIKP